MVADRNRNRAWAPLFIGALRKHTHIVGRHDIDTGQALFLDHETIDAAVKAVFRIASNHDAGGDHRSAVEDRRHRDRQLEQIDVVAFVDDFLGCGSLDVPGRNRIVDAMLQHLLDVGVVVASHREHRTLLRADDAREQRHLIADHVMKQQCLIALIDQRADVANVDRLPDVDQLVCGAQAIEETAKILVHVRCLTVEWCGKSRSAIALRTQCCECSRFEQGAIYFVGRRKR